MASDHDTRCWPVCFSSFRNFSLLFVFAKQDSVSCVAFLVFIHVAAVIVAFLVVVVVAVLMWF